MSVILLGMCAVPTHARTLSAAEAPLTGRYDGGQTELAAGLELGADGRFRYGLSYGALDEAAEGEWRLDGNRVLLTGDPVTPPQIVPVERLDAPAPGLTIKLDLPGGMPGQYFSAELSFGDGTVARRQLTKDGELSEPPGTRPPTAVTLTLALLDLRSEPVALAGTGGHRLRFRFDPNDLGRVAFASTPLRRDGSDLILARHGRTIRFRRQQADH